MKTIAIFLFAGMLVASASAHAQTSATNSEVPAGLVLERTATGATLHRVDATPTANSGQANAAHPVSVISNTAPVGYTIQRTATSATLTRIGAPVPTAVAQSASTTSGSAINMERDPRFTLTKDASGHVNAITFTPTATPAQPVGNSK
jgi:hypothetical protein